VTTVHQPLDTRIYYKEVRSLADYGYDVRLATTVARPDRRDGVAFIPLGSREGSRLRRIVRDLRALQTIFSNRDAIVHVHDPELLLVAALPAFSGARVVYDVHEFYVERIRGSEWIPQPLRRAAAAMYDAIERMVLPRFAGVVIVSEAMIPRYERFVPRERIALVRNFPNVDPSDFERARAAEHPLQGRPYILHTGGAMKLRAFADLVAAAETLRAADSDLTIVNLGHTDLSDYEPAERDRLLEGARRANVVMAGPVSYPETLRWLAHARIGYLPLIDTENNRRGMPNKLFEYALFGLPVVASNIGRVAQIVSETGAGQLVPIGDGAEHARTFMRIHSDPALHAQLTHASLEGARRYSFAGEFEALHTLYKRIEAGTIR
jgi:glycosyltransferase involved in cell wall biosynthesis